MQFGSCCWVPINKALAPAPTQHAWCTPSSISTHINNTNIEKVAIVVVASAAAVDDYDDDDDGAKRKCEQMQCSTIKMNIKREIRN